MHVVARMHVCTLQPCAMCVYIYIHVYIYITTYIICIYVYIYICVCVSVYVCVCNSCMHLCMKLFPCFFAMLWLLQQYSGVHIQKRLPLHAYACTCKRTAKANNKHLTHKERLMCLCIMSLCARVCIFSACFSGSKHIWGRGQHFHAAGSRSHGGNLQQTNSSDEWPHSHLYKHKNTLKIGWRGRERERAREREREQSAPA